jgi:DNA-binding SARP family transcriptional activator/tetratricopeptide (TPR) repeat protein
VDQDLHWSFDVLGPFRVLRDGDPVSLGAPQARAVLAVLAVNPNTVLSAERLVDEIWGASPPRSARVQLQGLVSQLRRSLAESSDGKGTPILTSSGGYLLRVGEGERDLDRFRAQVAAARELMGKDEPARAARSFRSALSRWRGAPLDGIEAVCVVQAAEQFTELRLAATEEVINAELRLGRHAILIAEITALSEQHPLRERLRGQLMTALARSGRVPEALEEFRKWRRHLVDELGVEPSAEIRAIHAGILRADPQLRPPVGLGMLKPPRPRQLPPDVPDFVGRIELLESLGARLTTARSPDSPPILVITGVAGSGKTALLVRLAHRVREQYPDGQLFVALRGAGDEPVSPATVLGRFLLALGVPTDLTPPDLDSRTTLFRDMTAGRRLLVVLDDAADEAQVRPLIPAEPGCAVLITGRHRLTGLAGAQPTRLGALSDDDSLRLLRALLGDDRVAEEAAAARQLTEYCGGLPLALRLIGAQLVDRPHWALVDLAERLTAERDRLDWLAAGDLAVRASLSLSYQRLGPDHQRMFGLLGLLTVPTFASWAAAALLDVDPRTGERLLDDLVASHLVEPAQRASSGPRYRLHDLVRCFAMETVETEPEHVRRAAVARAAGCWLHLAEQAADKMPGSPLRPAKGRAPRWSRALAGSRVGDAIGWFDAERYGLTEMVGAAADWGLAEHAWELAVVCGVYFDHEALYAEWRECYARALAAARPAGEDRGAAALLRGLGQVDIYEDLLDDAMIALEESREISERIDDRHGLARAYGGIATVHRVEGRLDECYRYGDLAIPLLDEAGDLHGGVQIRIGRAAVYRGLGRFQDAQAKLDEAMRLCSKLGDDHRTANAYLAQGELLLATRDTSRAMTYLRKARAIFESLGDRRCAANVRLRMGRAYTAIGDHTEAELVLALAATQFAELGNGTGEAECALLLGQIAARTAPR